jgi:hypothetical protein
MTVMATTSLAELSPPLHMVDKRPKLRSKIATAGVVEKEAGKRRAIVLKERDQLTRCDTGLEGVFHTEGDAAAGRPCGS